MSATVVLVPLGLGFVAGLLLRGQWRGRKVRLVRIPWPVIHVGRDRAAPPPPAPSLRPNARGMEPTAVYVPFDRHGAALYAGITNNLEARFRQHADSKDWSRQVSSVSAHIFPDRYAALAAEYALIHYLRPPHNTAPSGSCDAWTESRPAIRTALVRWPKGRAQVRGLLRRAA